MLSTTAQPANTLPGEAWGKHDSKYRQQARRKVSGPEEPQAHEADPDRVKGTASARRLNLEVPISQERKLWNVYPALQTVEQVPHGLHPVARHLAAWKHSLCAGLGEPW